jgi:hypothetical protein
MAAAALAVAAGCGSTGHRVGAVSAQVASGSSVSPTASVPHHHKVHHRRHRPRHTARVPAADLPNRSLTPGVALTVSAASVCVPGYASRVRDVPRSEKDAVYAEYGVVHVPYAHEVDHLISLELGGSNSIRNLWPEPYAGRWGAGTKDQLENRLHDLVCSGALTLARAQHIEASNWVAAYRRYVSPQPPARPRSTAGGGGSGPGSCTPGYSPCLIDHGGDYDCSGGDGNGPYFTQPGVTYVVSGSDPYRLDGNHDGRACG